MQIVQQVRYALRLGYLQPGDRLPTIREVVAKLAINPNTVFKAYRQLEMEGLITSHPGLGTFVLHGLEKPLSASLEVLRQELSSWLDKAEATGLDQESIRALFLSTIQRKKVRM
ncbi:MAG TPA: GntR family transcriptional regulator [Ktedonobacteraceae bacterium]|nr:GntR family transcriptional regulator [Ktedonobacteraceae bacterium]